MPNTYPSFRANLLDIYGNILIRTHEYSRYELDVVLVIHSLIGMVSVSILKIFC
jgi:hypothetical protein